MTDQNAADHWAELASEVGAEPLPQTDSIAGSEAASPARPVAPRPRAAAASKSPRRSAPAANWGELASELGIESPREPAPPVVRQQPTSPAAGPAMKPAPRRPVEPVTAPVTAPVVDEVSFSEPIAPADLVSDSAAQFAELAEELPTAAEQSADAQPEGTEAGTSERRGRRRRRRRRRGPRDVASEARTSASEGDEPAATSEIIDFDNLEGEIESESESETIEVADEVADVEPRQGEPEGEPGRRRPRRRRRRGPGRDRERTDDRERTEQDAQPADTLERAPVREPDDEISFDEPKVHEDDDSFDAGHDFEEEHEEGDDESPRIGFRNIPTWDNAISTIIAKNMESRAKNPNTGRPPSGHGRGGNRGRRRPPSH